MKYEDYVAWQSRGSEWKHLIKRSQEYHHRTKMIQIFLNFLNKRKANILDLASGDGWLAGEMKRLGQKYVTCMDLNKEKLEFAKKTYDVNTVEGDIQKLPFKDNTFDGIWFSQALEHCLDPDKAIKECIRVIKPGSGYIAITVPIEPGKKGIYHTHPFESIKAFYKFMDKYKQLTLYFEATYWLKNYSRNKDLFCIYANV